jgi:hypothetical protein
MSDSQKPRLAAGESASVDVVTGKLESVALDAKEPGDKASTLSYAAVAGKKSPESPSKDDEARKSMLSAEAAEFVPRWFKSEDKPEKPAAAPGKKTDSETDFAALDPASAATYREYAQKVLKAPNSADDILPEVLDKLKKEDAKARASALRGFHAIIVNHAASEHGARHAMGRMINVMLQTVDNKSSDLAPEFWDALNAQFQREHDNATKTLADNPGRFKTFAFFLAEVLGTSSRMFGHQKADELSDLLLNVLEDFFSTEDGEQWKIAGQVLKQVGAYLEDNFAKRKDSTGFSDMDRFMVGVETRGHSGREDIPFYIRSMLINIIELRAYNWGRSCSPTDAPVPPAPVPAAPAVPATPPVAPATMTVMHGHDELFDLNSEERRFLESEGCYVDDGHDEEDGMDEEMEKDYELFLQMNSNGQ